MYFKMALVPMSVTGVDKSRNFARTKAMIAQAAWRQGTLLDQSVKVLMTGLILVVGSSVAETSCFAAAADPAAVIKTASDKSTARDSLETMKARQRQAACGNAGSS
jgi:hypothetical protein